VFRLSDPPVRVFETIDDKRGWLVGHCLIGGARDGLYVWENSPEDRAEGQVTETFLMIVHADGGNPVTIMSEKSTFGAFTIRSPNWR
jgi:hypothetical protein